MTPLGLAVLTVIVTPVDPKPWAPIGIYPPTTFTIVTKIPKVAVPDYGCTWSAKTKRWRVCRK